MLALDELYNSFTVVKYFFYVFPDLDPIHSSLYLERLLNKHCLVFANMYIVYIW